MSIQVEVTCPRLSCDENERITTDILKRHELLTIPVDAVTFANNGGALLCRRLVELIQSVRVFCLDFGLLLL